MQNAIKLENISNLIASPSSYTCRTTTVSMKVSGFCYYICVHTFPLLTSKNKIDLSY
jgi:hypothetical protein